MASPPPPPKPLQQLNTYNALLSAFTDFLVVAIHTILYERGLYPPESFLLTRAYNFPVRQNRHPQVCKWVQDAVAAVRAQMLQGAVRRVVVVVYSEQHEVLERFLFDVDRFPAIPPKDAYTEFEPEGEDLHTSRLDVDEQLRAAVRNLAYSGGRLGELPPNCTYTVAVELKDEAGPPIGDTDAWVPSVPSLQTGDMGNDENIGSDLGGAKSLPVRSVAAGGFILESWIEEGKAKKGLAR